MRPINWSTYGTYEDSEYPELWDSTRGAWCPSLGPTGSGILWDHGKHRENAVLTNGDPIANWEVHDGRYCIRTDGTNDYWLINANASTLDDMAYTLAFWFRPLTLNTGGILQWADTLQAGIPFFLLRSTGQVLIDNTYATTLTLTQNAWHHFAIAREDVNNVTSIYLNGNLVTTRADDNDPLGRTGALRIYIGNGFGASSQYYANCQYDDIRWHGFPFDANRIKLLASERGVAYSPRLRRRLKRFFVTGGDPQTITVPVAVAEIVSVNPAVIATRTLTVPVAGANATANAPNYWGPAQTIVVPVAVAECRTAPVNTIVSTSSGSTTIRPINDVSETAWTGVGSTADKWANMDETTASDADYNWSTNNTAATLEVGLGTATDPATSSGHSFSYRIAKTDDGVLDGGGSAVTVTVSLYQGTTLIAADSAKTTTGTWTDYTYNLTSGEADAITNYNDLRLRFVTSASGGTSANRRGAGVSYAAMAIPTPATSHAYMPVTSGRLEATAVSPVISIGEPYTLLTAPVAGVNAAANAPSVTASVTLTVPVASANIVSSNPGVVGAVSLMVPVASAEATVAAPSVVPGGSMLLVPQATAQVSSSSPTLVPGATTLTVPVAVAEIVASSPTIQLSSTLTVPTAVAEITANAPPVVAGTSTIVVPVAQANAGTAAVAIAAGATTLTVPTAVAEIVASSPSVQASRNLVVPVAVAEATASSAGTITNVGLAVPVAVAEAAVTIPLVTAQVSVPLTVAVAEATVAAAPVVVPGGVSLTVPVAAAEARAAAVGVTTTVTVTAPVAVAEAVINAPPQLIGESEFLMVPEATLEAVGVAPTVISGPTGLLVALATVEATANAPTVATSCTLTVPVAVAEIRSTSPAISAGPSWVVVPPASAEIRASSPAVSSGPITLTVPVASAEARGEPPTPLGAGSYLPPSAAVLEARASSPGITTGSVTLTVPVAVAEIRALSPVVVPAPVVVVVPTAQADVAAVAPAISTGEAPPQTIVVPVAIAQVIATLPDLATTVAILVPLGVAEARALSPGFSGGLPQPVDLSLSGTANRVTSIAGRLNADTIAGSVPVQAALAAKRVLP